MTIEILIFILATSSFLIVIGVSTEFVQKMSRKNRNEDISQTRN